MNKVLKALPKSIRDYLLLKRIRRHHNRCTINSTSVSVLAKLGECVRIPEGCIVQESVEIGKHTYLQRDCEICNATIGSFCSLGSNILIGPFEHNTHLTSLSPVVYRDIIGGGV